MTDEEIKNAVAAYIIEGHVSDNADCLHEMNEWQDADDEDAQGDLKRAYEFYRTAIVTVAWSDK